MSSACPVTLYLPYPTSGDALSKAVSRPSQLWKFCTNKTGYYSLSISHVPGIGLSPFSPCLQESSQYPYVIRITMNFVAWLRALRQGKSRQYYRHSFLQGRKKSTLLRHPSIQLGLLMTPLHPSPAEGWTQQMWPWSFYSKPLRCPTTLSESCHCSPAHTSFEEGRESFLATLSGYLQDTGNQIRDRPLTQG